MNRDEKRPSSVGAPEGLAGEMKHCSVTYNSRSDFNMIRDPSQGLISSLLQYGRENAMSGSEIQSLLSLSDLRAVTFAINRERAAGIPICAAQSTPCGYFIPVDRSEVIKYRNTLQSRAKNLNAILNAVNVWLDYDSGQCYLEEFEQEETVM